MQYFPFGGSETTVDFERLGFNDLPQFIRQQGYPKATSSLQFNDGSPKLNQLLLPLSYASLVRNRVGHQHGYPIYALRFALEELITGEGQKYPVAEELFHAVREINQSKTTEHNQTTENKMTEDINLLKGIYDRMLVRRADERGSFCRNLSTVAAIDEFAVSAEPTLGAHADPGVRLGYFIGLAVIGFPLSDTHNNYIPARVGVEPVIESPSNQRIGLFPADMRVSSDLFRAPDLKAMIASQQSG